MTIKEKIKKTFIDLIKINEIYPHENEVIAYVKRRLRDSGIQYQEDKFRNIIAKVPGKGKAIMLSTHLDIPEPAPNVKFEVEKDIIRADGTNILGADPKTGLAVIIEFLVSLASIDHNRHTPVEAILTRGEEAGLFGARNCDYSLITAKQGLVLDEDGPVTQVVTQAPCYVRFDATFKGKVVHPREPEKGINALAAFCRAANAIPWGYSTKGVTWNIGLLNAGTARNSVPGHTTLHAELRSFNTKLAVSEAKRIEKTFCEQASAIKATCEVTQELEFDGYNLERSHPLFQRLEKTFKQLKLKPNYFATFGGSDANIFNAHGIKCVPIGSGYYDAHQYTESANIADMKEIYDFLHLFVKQKES